MLPMPDQKPTLDYQAPQPMVKRSYGGIRGTLLILLSIPFSIASFALTLAGAGGLASVYKEPRVDRAGDIWEMAIVIVLGLICGFVSVRWFKEGRRMAGDTK